MGEPSTSPRFPGATHRAFSNKSQKRYNAFTHVIDHQSKGRLAIQALNSEKEGTKVWVEASCHLKLRYIANTNDGIQPVINLVPGRRKLPSAIVEGGQAKPCLG